MDGLTIFLIAVVVLCTVILMAFVDVPDQIHNPVEFEGVGRVVKIAVAAVLAAWVLTMFVF